MHSQKIIIILIFVISAWVVPAQAQTLVYVDPDAPGANDGTSWYDAYYELQAALTAAVANTAIRVANATYNPGSSREDTFHLKNNVTVKEGYAGYGAPDPDEWDIMLYPSTLDGDNFNYHVVNGSGTDPTSVINGFIITGGNTPTSFQRTWMAVECIIMTAARQ